MKKIIKGIGLLVLALVIIVLGCLVYLTLTEYKPEFVEKSQSRFVDAPKVVLNKEIKVLSFNIGYGGLGKDNDFFMDGGKHVHGLNKADVERNTQGMINYLKNEKANIAMIQEVDEDSRRSYSVNQKERFFKEFNNSSMFTYNYKTEFVPYPWPPLGKVASGLLTQSDFLTTAAERIALSVPFDWPVRLVNLKRCILLSRHPVENSDKEFVVMNFHMDAYDDGEGRRKQTQQLLDLMVEEYTKGNYVLAGGDWNQSFFPRAEMPFKGKSETWPTHLIQRELIPKGWQLLTTKDFTPTCRLTNQPYVKDSENTVFHIIDGFLITPNIKVNEIFVDNLEFEFTDHNPVILKMELIK